MDFFSLSSRCFIFFFLYSFIVVVSLIRGTFDSLKSGRYHRRYIVLFAYNAVPRERIRPFRGFFVKIVSVETPFIRQINNGAKRAVSVPGALSILVSYAHFLNPLLRTHPFESGATTPYCAVLWCASIEY